MSNSLIEQAARRLEQLRRAGADVPPNALGSQMPVDRASHAGSPPESVGTMPAMGLAPDLSANVGSAGEVQAKTVNLDFRGLESRGFVTPNSPRTAVADQFRVIKRPLIANATGKGGTSLVAQGNLIMVTSSMPGEGKTFTSINLALSIASELDSTVMLVDSDVARPSILKTLGLDPSPGLLDLLTGKASSMGDVLLRTNVDKLTLLPAGTQHERATELLASDGMARLLSEMASRYADRIIIFDSPPLLLTTESRALASHMGQIVLVVSADLTLQSQVRSALALIESCPVKLAVLNRAAPGGVGSYGYGYGHGYGYGYGYGQRSSTGASPP